MKSREVVRAITHSGRTDYSDWLLPETERVLEAAGTRIELVDLFAIATGPGSFTGVRIGLTTVKAWCEIYGKPVVGVSRLEALARSAKHDAGLLAAYYDAQRGQIFAGLYRSALGPVERIGDEMVMTPQAFLELVGQQADEEPVQWVSLDPELLTGLKGWEAKARKGDAMHRAPAELAGTIGWIAEERAQRGEFTDPLRLDANYVRRSDAEIFWKGPAAHGR